MKKWVNDLQSGMYINCVYCGHQYGPKENTPISMADVLKQHIEKCPKHPMSKLKTKYADLEKAVEEWIDYIGDYDPHVYGSKNCLVRVEHYDKIKKILAALREEKKEK